MYIAVIETASAMIVYHIWYTFRNQFIVGYSMARIKVMLGF